MKPLLPLQIGKYTTPYPLIQGGMAVGVSGANLAGAVANSGCIGVISSFGLGLNSPEFIDPQTKRKRGKFFAANRLALIHELQKARAISPHGIIGVNILVAMRDYADLARTATEHGANLIITGGGLPLDLPAHTASHPDVALVPTVSTVMAAQTLCEHWQQHYDRRPDAFIVACPKTSGGHIPAKDEGMGDPPCSLEWLIPDLADYLKTTIPQPIPIIAAGGIWNRTDIDAMLGLGANGVQIGTRFILTHECDADLRYKAFHLQATPADTMLLPSPVGVPGRALRNSFAQRVTSRSLQLDQHCIANCLKECRYRDRKETYCILQALHCAAQGDIENGLIFSGTHPGRAKTILPVADLIAELTQTCSGIV